MRSVFLSIISLTLIIQVEAQKNEVPFTVKEGLFNLSDTVGLGLSFAPSVKSYTVFKPGDSDFKYNHGVVLFPFKGYLYAQWQSSSKDEDGADTRVMYSKSKNGKQWSKPQVLSQSKGSSIHTSGGWWSNGDRLVAYICVWPDSLDPKGGFTHYKISKDGKSWSKLKPLLDNDNKPIKGVIEQDVHALPNGRLITAIHEQPGLHVSPWFTDVSTGIAGWKKAKMKNLPYKKKNISREIEPSWFYRADSSVVMIFRDQSSSYKKLASISYDEGETWTQPTLINMPDSRAKQSAGNFPDGTAFQVSNPTGRKARFPLVITLSKDGFNFNKAYLIRSGGNDLQAMRYTGKYKRKGYSYPKSVVWKNKLYIGYATNKEDVEISILKIKKLK